MTMMTIMTMPEPTRARTPPRLPWMGQDIVMIVIIVMRRVTVLGKRNRYRASIMIAVVARVPAVGGAR